MTLYIKGTIEHHGFVDFGKDLNTKLRRGLLAMFDHSCPAVKMLISTAFCILRFKGAASGSILFEFITKTI
jgi:hypothetical protein